MADRIFGRKKSARSCPPPPSRRVTQIGSHICELIYQNNFEDFRRIVNRDNCNQLNLDDTSPMIAAVKTKNYKSLLWLLCCDADVQVKDPNHSRTALHWAVMSAYDEVQMRHRPVVEKAAAEAAEPLEQMANATPLDAIRWLLVFKADVNAADKNKDTPLSLSRNGDVARLLLANGADASKLGKKGRNFTPEAEESIRKWQRMSAAAKNEIQEKEKEAMERAKQSLNCVISRIPSSIGGSAESRTLIAVDAFDSPDTLYCNAPENQEYMHATSVEVEPKALRESLLKTIQSLREEKEKLQAENQSLYTASQEQLNHEGLLEEVKKLQRQNQELRQEPDNRTLNEQVANRLCEFAWRNEMQKLKQEVNKTNCNLHTDTGCTPLAAAADCDRLQVAEHLLSIGADVTAADNEGRTPLHRAALKDSTQVLNLLLKCDGVNVNAQDFHGDTPLMLARRENATAAAELLTNWVSSCVLESVRSGDPEQLKRHVTKDNCNSLHDGLTLLMVASQLPNNSGIRCVELLVQHPISADVNLRGRHGRSTLHFAAEFNNDRVLDLLLDKGAEMNAKDSNGDTPLMMAAANNREDAARELISKKAQLFARNNKGCTALNIAQDNKSNAVLELLRQASDSFTIDEQVKLLGRGAFADVHKVRTNHGDLLARKTVKVPFTEGDTKTEEELQKEVLEAQVLRSLRHQGIAEFLRLQLQQQDASAILFIELIDGVSLSSRINQSGQLSLLKVKDFSRQICQALNYIHHQLNPPVLHRDIKSANIMITNDQTVKLIDFGLAIHLLLKTTKSAHYSTDCGTLHFMSPEILSEISRYSRESDIWAFGCTVFHMATGSIPYGNCAPLNLASKIQKLGADKMPDTSGDTNLVHFYESCTQMDYTLRKSASDLLRHPFLQL